MDAIQGRELSAVPGGRSLQPSAAETPANAELKAVQFRAATTFNRLRDDVGRLGTVADTLELRQRIAEGSQRFKGLAQEFRAKVAQHPDRNSTTTQKVLRDFQALLKASERLMETAKAKEAASLPRPSAAAAAAAEQQQRQSAAEHEAAERQALLEKDRKQQLLLVENALQFNEAVIAERDQAITQIAGQIGEVHQIFQDLAVLVNDQSEMLGDIESNITRAAERTADATVQITRAERSQRSAQRKWCLLLLGAALAMFILLLIVLA